MVSRCQKRISGPLLDRSAKPPSRIDTLRRIEVPRVEYDKLSDKRSSQLDSRWLRRRWHQRCQPLQADYRRADLHAGPGTARHPVAQASNRHATSHPHPGATDHDTAVDPHPGATEHYPGAS